jgi:hypothetical protein
MSTSTRSGRKSGERSDGREYHIVKHFHEPQPLRQRLADLGWDAQIQTTNEFFIYGQASLAGS